MRGLVLLLVFFGSSSIAGAAVISNPGFEDTLTSWEPSGNVARITNSFFANSGPCYSDPDCNERLLTFNPVEGSYFALLNTGGGSPDTAYSQLTQKITVLPGQIITGSYFFSTNDYRPYDDTAVIEMVPDDANLESIPLAEVSVFDVGDYNSTQTWQTFAHTFTAKQGGTYTLSIRVDDAIDCVFPSYLAVDALSVFPDPMCVYALNGDFNDDCKVDLVDFAIIAGNWFGEPPPAELPPDTEIITNFDDLMQLATDWLIDCFVEPDNTACVHK